MNNQKRFGRNKRIKSFDLKAGLPQKASRVTGAARGSNSSGAGSRGEFWREGYKDGVPCAKWRYFYRKNK